MDLRVILELLSILLLIGLNAFFAASEIAVVSVRKTRIRQLMEEGNPAAIIIHRLLQNPSRFLATIQVWITLAGFFASALGAVTAAAVITDILSRVPVSFISESSGALAIIIVTVVVAFATLVLGELTPKTLAIHHSESIALSVARFLEILGKVSIPMVAVLTATTNVILRLLGSDQKAQLPSITEEEIISLVDAGEEEGVVDDVEAGMIHGVFDFGETRAREVMVPRIDTVSIESSASIQDALNLLISSGHSRIPVYQESLDNILGVLYAKDLLKHFAGRQQLQTVTDVMRPATFFPESKKVGELFKELQRSRTHMAIIVDEYGGTAGVVTLEDLIEEIVGEIRDEYDMEERTFELTGPDEAIASGRASLNELNELLNIDLQVEDVDTIGGLVYSELGRIPNPGDKVELPELTVTVVSVSGHRIKQVRIQKHLPSDTSQEQAR